MNPITPEQFAFILLMGVLSFMGGYALSRFHQGGARRIADRITERIFGRNEDT